MFKNRTIHKTYLALVEGHPPRQGTIDFQIGRHPFHRNKMAVFNCPDINNFSSDHTKSIRDATTNYKVVTYFENHSLVEVKPTTGRTHQIRVHFAALGHPLVGDLLYGNKTHLMQRHTLHAHALSFALDGKTHTFTSEVPADFAHLLSSLS